MTHKLKLVEDAELAIDLAAELLATHRGITEIERELRECLNSSSFGTQVDLARTLKISPQYLSDILKGRRGFSIETAKAITKLKGRAKPIATSK